MLLEKSNSKVYLSVTWVPPDIVEVNVWCIYPQIVLVPGSGKGAWKGLAFSALLSSILKFKNHFSNENR